MSQQLLEGGVFDTDTSDVVDPAISALHERIDELETQAARRAVITVLNLLAQALKQVASGQMDLAEPVVSAAPQFDPKWEAWKQKLGAGTAPARIIDAILNHGPLNRTQLRAASEAGWSTLDAATGRLKNLGLIEKVGDKWNLKS